ARSSEGQKVFFGKSFLDSVLRVLRAFVAISLMLIPAIDLKDGAVVQLVQGEKLAIRDDDIEKWVTRFARFPKVQVIDLDAAMGSGDNLSIVRHIAPRLTCRVGGGIRTAARATEILAAGGRRAVARAAPLTGARTEL